MFWFSPSLKKKYWSEIFYTALFGVNYSGSMWAPFVPFFRHLQLERIRCSGKGSPDM
uniref:Uncharacterized protein n=1 Tax=Anguilla anguilla TaxID=7936 RepID=A0A0E9PY33_ANGAN